MHMFQHTVSARAGDGFSVHVTFADGTGGVFDLSPYMEYPCYEPLRDRALFEKVQAAHGTLAWPGEIDISPEAVWADAVRPATAEKILISPLDSLSPEGV